VVSLAVVMLAATAPTVSAGEEVVAQVPGATGLTACGGHVVWSRPDPATGLWTLEQWHAGRVSRLPDEQVPCAPCGSRRRSVAWGVPSRG
jgi:hypothetical protein